MNKTKLIKDMKKDISFLKGLKSFGTDCIIKATVGSITGYIEQLEQLEQPRKELSKGMFVETKYGIYEVTDIQGEDIYVYPCIEEIDSTKIKEKDVLKILEQPKPLELSKKEFLYLDHLLKLEKTATAYEPHKEYIESIELKMKELGAWE